MDFFFGRSSKTLFGRSHCKRPASHLQFLHRVNVAAREIEQRRRFRCPSKDKKITDPLRCCDNATEQPSFAASTNLCSKRVCGCTIMQVVVARPVCLQELSESLQTQGGVAGGYACFRKGLFRIWPWTSLEPALMLPVRVGRSPQADHRRMDSCTCLRKKVWSQPER